MTVDDPLMPTTVIGPIVSEASLHPNPRDDRTRRRQRRPASCARAAAGPSDLAPGFFVEPTIFSDVDPTSEIAQDEVFGPVLSVFAFDGEDEAIALANGTEYGLTGFVNTSSLDRAHRVARRLDTGSVSINGFTGGGNRGGVAQPFGGVKGSGFGREGGQAGIAEFLTTKNVYVGLG